MKETYVADCVLWKWTLRPSLGCKMFMMKGRGEKCCLLGRSPEAVCPGKGAAPGKVALQVGQSPRELTAGSRLLATLPATEGKSFLEGRP